MFDSTQFKGQDTYNLIIFCIVDALREGWFILYYTCVTVLEEMIWSNELLTVTRLMTMM